MSIVRQIIDTVGGKIEISSEPPVGTKLTVKLALARPELRQPNVGEHDRFLSFLPRLRGRKICILHKEANSSSINMVEQRTQEGLNHFTAALKTTLERHLQMDVIQTSEWQGHDAELVVCPEVSFDYLSAIRRGRLNTARAPVTIFVAMDALEAAALRSDIRVTDRQSVVEIITQP